MAEKDSSLQRAVMWIDIVQPNWYLSSGKQSSDCISNNPLFILFLNNFLKINFRRKYFQVRGQILMSYRSKGHLTAGYIEFL